MFVPVGCANCGKPFQVPEAALGKSATCPWCQSVVTALPIAGMGEPAPLAPEPPVPAGLKGLTSDPPAPAQAARAGAASESHSPRPLSLDDDELSTPPVSSSDAPAPKPRRRLPLGRIAAVIALSLAVTVLTVAVLGYGSGRVHESWWAEYTPPDGSCSVLLPGPPVEEEVSANPTGSVTGGKRYVVRGWYTRSAAWLAWNDLEPAFAQTVAKDRDKVFTASAIQAELGREKARLQGTVTKEAEIRSNAFWGIEVHMDTPRGRVIEWLLVAGGTRPRLYTYGVQATNIAPDSAIVRRMFTSFQVKE